MKPFEVRLVLPVVVPLLEVIKGQVRELQSSPAIPGDSVPSSDSDLSEAWRSELLTSQRGDLELFMALFGDEFINEGVIAFDAANAEAVIRSCSAVRLRLRERPLKGLGDEALESGDVHLDTVPEDLRKAFMCYLFLATLQELIISRLDDGAP
ncbi:MAG TPA: hypothetical protein VFE31_09835 [Opitutaceae bacterium]|jgi:hypothetical protein|nr:hypothetical protein [Opitutaceae bacterium]